MKNLKYGLGLSFFIFIAVILYFNFDNDDSNSETETIEKDNKLIVEEIEKNPLNNSKFADNNDIYKEDKDSNVDNIYITILPPSSENTVTFDELNYTENYRTDYISDNYDPVVEIIFNKDKSNNLEINKSNATMELRGQSSRLSIQKSYKIKLYDNTKTWNGFKTINLNKHFKDTLRIRNKLSFDYFEIIPNFTSLRTRFVRLHIKDLSSKEKDTEYKYNGLYTFIEQPNKRFLERHNLDTHGNLYKAEFFEFYRYENNIKYKEDITYDKNEFEKILEVNGNDNHEKLIKMLDDLNDYNKDINEIVDKYFDKDNLLTWIAVNILFDNHDTNSRNFILYSPLNSDKWYFLPWDYDKGWTFTEYRGKWQKGLSNYWGMVIFNRFFKYPSNIEDLSAKIEEISSIINEKNTKMFLDSYYDVVKENVFISPDIAHLNTTLKEYTEEYNLIPKLTEKNKEYYYESLENPMPFYLGESKNISEIYKFNWDLSYDLQGDDIIYTFILSKDSKFNDIFIKYEKLSKSTCTVEDLESGEYYWKVIAYDSKGNYQEAFDYARVDGSTVYGIKKFTVD